MLYIVQRMAGLAALFTVFGLCLYLHGRLRMQSARPGLPHILTGLLLFGGLAVLSKENGILLPLYMLVLEITLFRFRSGQDGYDRRIVAFFLLTVAIPAVLFLLVLVVYPEKLMNYSVRTFTMPERVMTELRVLVFYLKQIVMPSISELGLYHDDIRISHGLLDPPTTLLSLLTLAGLLVAALALITRQPLISLGILWFFAGHVLESTVLSLEIAHEHRNYLADYGILLAICALALQARSLRVWPVIRIAGPVAFLLFSGTTLIRAEQWSDNVHQAVYEARHHPQSARALLAAGRIYARMALQHVPDSEQKAFAFLARASALDRSGIMPDVIEMQLRYALDRPVEKELFARIRHKLAVNPVSAADILSLQALAECLETYCKAPVQQVDELFRTALAQHYSPQLDVRYGFFKINQQSDFQAGLKIFRRVLKERPREAASWTNLMSLLLAMQRFDEAQRLLARLDSVELYGGNDTTREQMTRDLAEARKAAGLTDGKKLAEAPLEQ